MSNLTVSQINRAGALLIIRHCLESLKLEEICPLAVACHMRAHRGDKGPAARSKKAAFEIIDNALISTRKPYLGGEWTQGDSARNRVFRVIVALHADLKVTGDGLEQAEAAIAALTPEGERVWSRALFAEVDEKSRKENEEWRASRKRGERLGNAWRRRIMLFLNTRKAMADLLKTPGICQIYLDYDTLIGEDKSGDTFTNSRITVLIDPEKDRRSGVEIFLDNGRFGESWAPTAEMGWYSGGDKTLDHYEKFNAAHTQALEITKACIRMAEEVEAEDRDREATEAAPGLIEKGGFQQSLDADGWDSMERYVHQVLNALEATHVLAEMRRRQECANSDPLEKMAYAEGHWTGENPDAHADAAAEAARDNDDGVELGRPWGVTHFTP